MRRKEMVEIHAKRERQVRALLRMVTLAFALVLLVATCVAVRWATGQ